jgi:hypothetical protein
MCPEPVLTRTRAQLGILAGTDRSRPRPLKVLLQVEIERLADDVGLVASSSARKITHTAL